MFGVKMLRGRAISADDRAGRERVVVISESFARRFAGGDPIGRRIRLTDGENGGDWLTVVGVMPTLFAATMDNNAFPSEVLTAFWQENEPSSAVIAMLGDDGVTATLRKLVTSLDRDMPVYEVSSLDADLARSIWPMRLFGGTFVVFGILAIVLAAIGLYAVMAFSVSRRVREIGIRLALGATRRDVVRMIFRGAVVTIGFGMTVGLLLGALLARGLSGVLFGISATDPVVFGIVGGVLVVVALIACLVPANRATRLDPVIALRSD
jgi:putative ABC transport system permease protein